MIAAASIIEVVAAALFVRSISLGTTLLAAILAVGTLVATVYGAKWKATAATAQATAELWEQNARGERDRADAAVVDKDRLIVAIDDARKTIAELRALPSVESLANVLAAHETRAQERQQAIVTTVAQLSEQHATMVPLMQTIVETLVELKGVPT